MSMHSAGTWELIAKTDAINQYWMIAREISDAAIVAINEQGAPVNTVLVHLHAALKEEHRRCVDRINPGPDTDGPG